MIQGFVNQELAYTVNFLMSRSGLSTVGYTLLNKNHTVFRSRSVTGVVEVQSGGSPTGIYSVKLKLTEEFVGYILWDTGQDPEGTGVDRLRSAVEEVSIIPAVEGGSGGLTTVLLDIMEAVKALYEENTIKLADQTTPNSLRIIRKRPEDADWSDPYSDTTIPVIRRPGQFRYGGPLE